MENIEKSRQDKPSTSKTIEKQSPESKANKSTKSKIPSSNNETDHSHTEKHQFDKVKVRNKWKRKFLWVLFELWLILILLD